MTLDGRIGQCLEMERSQRVDASILSVYRPYTSPEPLKAASWSRRGFSLRFDPLTVCTYDLDIEEMVDLTTDQDVARPTSNFRNYNALGRKTWRQEKSRLPGRSPSG
jgi:hypothetical protein